MQLIFTNVKRPLTKSDMLAVAADYNHTELFYNLLELPGAEIYASGMDNGALRYAACRGYLHFVNRLLKINTVAEQAADLNNLALKWAVEKNHRPVVNVLLEYAAVRQSQLPFHEGRCAIMQGLKRALWLSLQSAPGFSDISSLAELTVFAMSYLKQHPDWVHALCTDSMRNTLTQSLSRQVISMTFTAPYVALQKSNPSMDANKMSLLRLPLDLIDKISSHAGLVTEALSHFKEPKFAPTQILAFNIIKARCAVHTQENAISPLNRRISSLDL